MMYDIQLDDDFDIKVGAHTIHVRIVGPEDNGLDRNNHGVWRPDEYTIYVNKRDPYSVKLSTLFHEILHVVEQFYEIKISHKDLNITGDVLSQIMLDSFARQQESRRKKR